jgi:hypothetical protein
MTAGLALVGAGLLALLLPSGGVAGPARSAFFGDPGGGLQAPGSGITLDQRSKSALVLQSAVYRLTIAKRNGGMVELLDRTTGARVVKASNGCLWGTVAAGDPTYIGGCLHTPSGQARFSYDWNKASSMLTLTYEPDPAAAKAVHAVVTIKAARTYFDLQVTLDNRTSRVLQSVSFPADLIEDENLVEAGYAPTFLPGVRLLPSFFRRDGNNVLTYPSRWAFADYLGLDLGGSHLALYSVNPAPSPIAPVSLGFIHSGGGPCSDSSFCVVHTFPTWVPAGKSWTSPVMRIRVGDPVSDTIVDYRVDNGISAYPSVQAKAGSRWPALAEAPLIKADLEKAAPPFAQWPSALAQLPKPALLHPVAFGPGGFDAKNPDVLPPDSRAGTIGDFQAAVQAAHARGQLVMPYLNVSWWNPQSPTVQNLPSPLTPDAIAVQRDGGQPVRQQFSGVDGYVVSPSVPFVRRRVDDEFERWRSQVPTDCLFFDQIGARPWTLDFNPDSPTPLAYDDAWLSLMAPYSDRCLMVEDGWDRLAASFVGFHGGLMLMQREFDWLDDMIGHTWETFPLALWLFHDKALLYQHDLYEETMTRDPEILTWGLAYGFMLSYSWDAQANSLASPWLDLVGDFQRALGPHYAGAALTSYKQVADNVTETRFGDFSVVADWSRTAGYAAGDYGVAPGGFVARTDDGSVVAGAFAGTFGGAPLSSGTHYVVVARSQGVVTVQQPLGGDTALAVDPPAGWSSGQALRASALARDGSVIGDAGGQVTNGRFVFTYLGSRGGVPVAGYRVTVG